MKRNKKLYLEIKPILKKPILPSIVLICTLIVGTLGYYILWIDDYDVTLFDAFYMTFITITTIGYSEIFPLDQTGRVLTIFVALVGISSLFFMFTIVMENLFILQINNYGRKKKMVKTVENLKNHTILIGYGRVGQLAALELLKNHEQFVVIDDDFQENDIINQKEFLLKIKGDATHDEVLIKAGIKRAKGLIIATGNPATNVFIVLGAKVLNPNLTIVARCDEHESIEKLIRAGATQIVNPFSIGGQRLAHYIINPNVIDFVETNFGSGEEKFNIENIKIPENSIWNNQTLKEMNIREQTGVTILAIRRGERTILNPPADFSINDGDEFLAFGTLKDLKKVERMLFMTK
jgi:voltage-gated potassium channel